MSCHPAKSRLPRIWLFTDPRIDTRLAQTVRRLPRESGVIVRHYDLPAGQRRLLFARLRRIARRRGHMILLAGPPRLARRWQADGVHGRAHDKRQCGRLLLSHPVHDRTEIRTAERRGADLLFLSPLYATRSHAGQRPLGVHRFHRLARTTRLPVLALGGMTRSRALMLGRTIRGWGAIDSLAD